MNSRQYHALTWKPRALAFARSLHGRERTPVEKEVSAEAKEHDDPWLYFMVFGIQPETQAYVDKTIELIDSLDPDDPEYWGDQITTEVRLDFSAEDLLLDPARRKMYDDARERKWAKERRKEKVNEQ